MVSHGVTCLLEGGRCRNQEQESKEVPVAQYFIRSPNSNTTWGEYAQTRSPHREINVAHGGETSTPKHIPKTVQLPRERKPCGADMHP
jgi:hypothetical protein